MNNIRKTKKYEAIKLAWLDSGTFFIAYYETEDAKDFFKQVMKLEKQKKEYVISLRTFREEVTNEH